jgi:predicted ATPase
MLRKLDLTNFKAWKTLRLPFGKITGLFGANSSGKSSVLQFLLLLKQTKNATDRGLVLDFGGPAELVNLGRFQDVVHKRDDGSDIEWTLGWKLPDSLKVSDPTGQRTAVLMRGNNLQLNCAIGLKRSALTARRLRYRFARTDFLIEPRSEDATEYVLRSEGSHPVRFTRNRGRGWALPGPVKTHLFPDRVQTLFQDTSFLSDFETEYEGLMDRIYYLGPLREHPQREYRWSGVGPVDVGPAGERTIDAILAATSNSELRNLGWRMRLMRFQEMIAYWLRELGLIESFEIQEIAQGSNLYHARVRVNQLGPETMLTDVGFGVSQVLPVLVLLYYVPEGSIVLMEQPEIHLHPSVQSGLADVMLAVAGRRNLQIIVESHSEHLLRRFQRRAAEGDTDSSDLKLYFVNNDNGVARLNDLALNAFGEIENWPAHFFGDEVGEIAAISKASLKRRIEASQ